jgi:hypothetical protein
MNETKKPAKLNKDDRVNEPRDRRPTGGDKPEPALLSNHDVQSNRCSSQHSA